MSYLVIIYNNMYLLFMRKDIKHTTCIHGIDIRSTTLYKYKTSHIKHYTFFIKIGHAYRCVIIVIVCLYYYYMVIMK